MITLKKKEKESSKEFARRIVLFPGDYFRTLRRKHPGQLSSPSRRPASVLPQNWGFILELSFR